VPGPLGAGPGQHQPGVVDQRLDEPAVVAVAAPQLERLTEVLLGLVQPAVHHRVPALLGQRRSGTVGLARLPVKHERITGELVGALPGRGSLAGPGSHQQRIGDQDRVPDVARCGHCRVAECGRLRGVDQYGPTPQRRQRRGLNGRLARPGSCRPGRLELPSGLVEEVLGEREHSVAVQGGRTERCGGGWGAASPCASQPRTS
jgi:hypothetical protein